MNVVPTIFSQVCEAVAMLGIPISGKCYVLDVLKKMRVCFAYCMKIIDETLMELIQEVGQVSKTKNEELVVQFTNFLILMEKITKLEKKIDLDTMMRAVK